MWKTTCRAAQRGAVRFGCNKSALALGCHAASCKSAPQVGNARWRLVGAPSLPSLMSLPDPVSEPSRFLSTLALGTEVEVAFGKRLQVRTAPGVGYRYGSRYRRP